MSAENRHDDRPASEPIVVELADRRYPIHVERGLLPRVGPMLAGSVGKRLLVVADENVGPLYADVVLGSLRESGFEPTLAAIPAGEGTKSPGHYLSLCEAALDAGLDRRSAIVALGGGVVGDLAGFVAATFARGIAFVQLPTSLLAMVDSSVGGKVGIDLPRAKNILGSFHQPNIVLCDVDCLKTLPGREYLSGLAEVVKYGVILDAAFFEWLEANVEPIRQRDEPTLVRIIRRCCEIKADVVRQDEFETSGLRAALNYGHTFGHAFETVTGYSRLTHGEAVAIGMICAGYLAAERKLAPNDLVERQRKLWSALSLPISPPADLSIDSILEAMRRDKKTIDGNLRFVLPARIGEVRLVEGIPESAVRHAIQSAISG